jgi:trimeric autotransporter adhesin
MRIIIKNNYNFKFSFLKNGREIICVLTLLLFIGYKTNAQNVSYNINSIPIPGIQNTAFGFQPLLSNTTGIYNSALGFKALSSNTTGNYNTANGHTALFSNTQGSANTANGYRALYSNTAGIANNAFGVNSLSSNTTGYQNTALGAVSLASNISGINNTAIGWGALFSNTLGNDNIAIGFLADVSSNTLSNATSIGSGAIVNASNNMQFGNSAVTKIYAGTGTNATLIAGGLQITGGVLVAGKVLTSDAVGNATWQTPSGGGGGTGWGLTGNTGTVDGTNFIGTTDNVPFNIRVNNVKAARIDPILSNSFYGIQAGLNNTAGGNNTSHGFKALFTNTTGTNNTALGNAADVATGALTNATAIGSGAIVSASNTMQFGNSAVTKIYAGTGTNATLIVGGLQVTGGILAAGKVLTSDAVGNATWQTPAGGGGTGWGLTGNAGTIDGTNFIGTTDNIPFNIRLNNKQAGRIDPFLFNTFYGQEAGLNNTVGRLNVANGFHALFSNTEGRANIAIGHEALASNTKGSANVSVGYQAQFSNEFGNENTAIGGSALRFITFGDANTALGYQANTSTTNSIFNSSAIGAYSLANIDNKIRLGDANVTVVEGPVAYTPSDLRFKNNIIETDVIGLEFIKRLRPVVYNFDTRKFTEFLTQNMPDSLSSKYLNKDFTLSTAIRQSGFIAQEVEVAAAAVGYDFNGLHKPETKDDNYSLAYSQFVVPLVKAVQELSAQNTSLKQAIDEQAKTNETLKNEMAALKALVIANKNVEGSIKITEASNEAKLFQNAPNPFNKATTIRYKIPSAATKAAITITSLEGKKIKTFELNSKNGQSLDINGGQLSAGTYIYTLIVDDVFIDSKTMIMTK